MASSEAPTLSMAVVAGVWTALVEVALPGAEYLCAEAARDVIEAELERASALEARVGVLVRR